MRFWLRPRARRVPPRRRAVPLRARGHQLREPARDPRLPQAAARDDRRRVPRPGAARRGQPVAGGRRRLLRRRRRVPHGVPLPGHAAHVHGAAPRGGDADRTRSWSGRRTSPTNCQWGIFLRNHDELTLEMVTDEERDYMYAEYAKDPRMRINVGIRRRLAPLLDNGRDEMELLHALLFSLPGTPGPVLRRRDRHGRQHLPRRPRRRAHADAVDRRPQRAASRAPTSPSSTCRRSWTRSTASRPSTSRPSSARRRRCCAGCKRFIALRKEHPVFGLGTLRAAGARATRRSSPTSARYEDDVVLCVHNLARSAQAVELDLSAYEGRSPDGDVRPHALPAHRRAALPAHARAARLLLVPARRTPTPTGADRWQR